MHALYKLTFKSGKSYIGQTVRKMQTRLTQHRAAANRGSLLPVHCAWRSHGEPDLQVIGLYESHEDLHQAEIEAIASHNTLAPNGYNLGHGGETAPSKNPDVARKIAERAKGRRHSDTSAWSDAVKAQWQNQEYRDKVTSSLKAAWTPEMRAERSRVAKAAWVRRKENGWSMPEATKEKLKGRSFSEETKRKMSESAKARVRKPVSDETRKKLSDRTKQAWADELITEKRLTAMKEGKKGAKINMSEAAVRTWQNPEVRARRIEALRAAKEKKRNQPD